MSNVYPYWLGHYLGIPYTEKGRDRQGMDDWGLYRLITAEQFGIATTSGTNIKKEAFLKSVLGCFVEVTNPKIGDAVLIGSLSDGLIGMHLSGNVMITCTYAIKTGSFLLNYKEHHRRYYRYKSVNDYK